MTSAPRCVRGALKRKASVSGLVTRPSRWRSSSRRRSPSSVPPGSRARTTSTPPAPRVAARRAAWLVLPDPARPPRGGKRPRPPPAPRARRGTARAAGGRAAARLRDEVGALGELMLEAADGGVLWGQLDRLGAAHDETD